MVLDDEVPTAAEAARVLDCDVAAIANSLVFDSGGSPLLILASGAARVDTKLVAAELGLDRIRRADADFVLTHTGQAIGGVAPVGHPAPIRTVLDRSLAGLPCCGPAPVIIGRCSRSASTTCAGSLRPW